MADNLRLLAFDYGLKRIGVAVGQQLTGTATPLKILSARDGIPDWDEIRKIIQEWQPDLAVVGNPLNMDGSESEMSLRARKFANRLHGRFGVKVEMTDERLSSYVNRSPVSGGDGHSRTGGIDALAAATICEDWLRKT
jgi:putative Holliday junction resolvase